MYFWGIRDKIKGIVTKDREIKYFIGIELFLYGLFLSLDILCVRTEISNVIKYSAMWVCFSYVLYTFLKNRKKECIFMVGILTFTLLADTFLLFSSQYKIGVAAFIIVQILYSYKIRIICCDGCKKYMLEVFGVAFFWNLVVLILKNENLLNPTIAIASLYFIIFTGNMIRIWGQVIRNESVNYLQLSLAIGLLLFYLCDISVGLNYLHTMNLIKKGFFYSITAYSGVLMWIFYLPSQVILAIQGVSYE